MVLWFVHHYSEQYPCLLALNHVSLRAIFAAATALLTSLFCGPWVIRQLQRYQIGQVVRKEGPSSHYTKEGTPTMGGVLILLAISLSTLLWAALDSFWVWILLLTTLGFGCIGFTDDMLKCIKKHNSGLSGAWKLGLQSLVAVIALWFLHHHAVLPVETQLVFPLFKDYSIQLHGGYFILGYLVLVGASNAVNLTDGLDGLAMMPVVMVAAGLGIYAYLTGHAHFSEYLHMPWIPGAGEVAIFCSAIIGAGLGFLWFNTYPAQIFMGDVGSLSLGAALGMVAMVIRQELVFMIMGGIFVAETVSVILQVGSFKLRGKRIFKMAPLHHHFELKGWPEPRIIVRFWIVTFLLVLISLASLKLR